jgi:hypothetical protein
MAASLPAHRFISLPLTVCVARLQNAGTRELFPIKSALAIIQRSNVLQLICSSSMFRRRWAVRAAVTGCAALTALTACPILTGARPASADTYVQDGDVPAAEYLSNSRDGTRAVKRSDSNDYNVEVWDPRSKTLISSITGLSGAVNTANISPDGRQVVTAERTGIVGVWDAETGKQVRLLRGHEDQVHDARFSPDGKVIASGARDGTARTWDPETGAQIAVHKQHGGSYVDAVSFSPDGRWVLSAGNGWADVWNARSGKDYSSTVVGPEGEGGFTTFARFSPNGKSIVVTDDEDKTKAIPIELPAE